MDLKANYKRISRKIIGTLKIKYFKLFFFLIFLMTRRGSHMKAQRVFYKGKPIVQETIRRLVWLGQGKQVWEMRLEE